jgi:hypothetical protein
MTVAQGLFHDRKVPAMTMEQMVEYNSKLTRCPTAADRQEFGAALVRALAEARIVSKVTDYRTNLALY